MPIFTAFFVLGASELWCLGVLAKLATSWRGGYVFGVWDGGFLFGGKRLGATGRLIYATFVGTLAVADGYLLRQLAA